MHRNHSTQTLNLSSPTFSSRFLERTQLGRPNFTNCLINRMWFLKETSATFCTGSRRLSKAYDTVGKSNCYAFQTWVSRLPSSAGYPPSSTIDRQKSNFSTSSAAVRFATGFSISTVTVLVLHQRSHKQILRKNCDYNVR